MDTEQRKAAMKAIREAEWFGEPVPIIRESPHSTFGKAL
jgi:peptide deformylase